MLYLENNLAPRVFTSSRFALLELLASQAAISLDNATLYADLAELRCSFRSSKVCEESLAPSVQQDLLRIAQEAISNAIRHARPTVISLSLRRNPPNLVLKIRDNGSGIANDRSSGEGFGFANMRARAKNIGAELDIRSRAGSGTSVVVRLPIISRAG